MRTDVADTWDFLTVEPNSEMSNVVLEAAKRYDFAKRGDDINMVSAKLQKWFGSYTEFISDISSFTSAGNSVKDMDMNIMFAFVKRALLKNDELRQTFVRAERFRTAEKGPFKREFDHRSHNSDMFALKMPILCLAMAIPDDRSLIDRAIKTAATTLSLSKFAMGLGMGGILAAIPMAVVGGPIYDAIRKIGRKLMVLIETEDEYAGYQFMEYMPFYITVIVAHFLHSAKIENVDEAKAYLRNLISENERRELMTDEWNHEGWSTIRLYLLEEFADQLAEEKGYTGVHALLRDAKSLVPKYDASDIVPGYIMSQLMKYPEELIDFIYGLDATPARRELLMTLDREAPKSGSKVLFGVYAMPFVEVTDNRTFYVNGLDSQKVDLTRLYVALKGYDPTKKVVTVYAPVSYDYVIEHDTAKLSQNKAVRNDQTKDAPEYERRIAELEHSLAILTHRNSSYEALLTHLRHDVRKDVLVPIDKALKSYAAIIAGSGSEMPELERMWCQKALESISQLYLEFKKFDDYRNPEALPATKVSLEELLEGIDSYGIRVVIPDKHLLGNTFVMTDSVRFKTVVLANIMKNALRHAFPTDELRANGIVRIELIDGGDDIILSLSNNGLPFTGDAERAFVRGYTSGLTGNTGEGLYLVRDFMREYQGDSRIMVSPESDFSFSMILTFKTPNTYVENIMAR